MSTQLPHKASAFFSLLLAAVICCGCTSTGMNSEMPDTSSERSSVPTQTTSSTEKTSSVPEPEPYVPKIDPDYEGLAKALDKAMDDYNVTGMSVAVFKDDQILYTYGNGFADVENKVPFTDNTRSRIASISKMVTSMIMMTLYDQGKITPDTVLSDVTGLPFDAPGKGKIKLWHLMTHTSGLIDTEAFTVRGVNNITTLLNVSHSRYEPGTAYIYTNFGAGTAGAVIEHLTGEFFFDYADKALFKPLGMDAGYNIEMIKDKESVAKLYDYDGTVTDVQHWRRNRAFYSAIGKGNSCYCAQCELIINVKDLARLGMLMTNDGTLDGVKILSKDAVDLMEKRFFSAPDYDMGLSVRIYDDLLEDRTIYGHNGIAFGAITGLYYDPVDKTGIAVITNGCGAYADENGFYMINKDTLNAAYKYVFETGDFAKTPAESGTSDSTGE